MTDTVTKSPEYEKGYEDGLRDGHTAASQDAAKLYGVVGRPTGFGSRLYYSVVRLVEIDGVMIGLPVNDKGEVDFERAPSMQFQFSQKTAAFKVARSLGTTHDKMLVGAGHSVSTLREARTIFT